MQFKNIKGQTVTANRLTEIIDSGRVSHTQLFLGESASGSLAMAIAYAQYLNCEHRQHYDNAGPGELRADSCGECPNCKKYQQLSHSDLHLFFPSATTANVKGTNISSADFQGEFREFLMAKNQMGTLDEWYEFMQIENKQGQIRERDADEMVRILGMKSYEGGRKVAIIWMAEKMKPPVANKILKCLEEPTPGTLIILVAESSDKMLSTILSRTQLVKIGTIQKDAVAASDEFRMLYVTWMRQLFKLNMASLSAWVDNLHSKSREVQKQFLTFAQEAIRDAFLRNNAGLPSHIDFGDEKFNSSFPSMITERNIEALNEAFNNAIFAVERNAYGKIVFMELSFRISKALKKR